MYQQMIAQTLVSLAEQEARRGQVGRGGFLQVEPRHVEAWMRLEYGTLDHLGGDRWTRAVREAAEDAMAAPAQMNEELARSEGLTRWRTR